MHIAEGMLPLTHAALWTAVAAPFIVVGARKARALMADEDPKRRAMLGFAGALIFAMTLFPLPVPFIGMTSHLCATPILAIILGWRLIVIPSLIVLLLQALFFAHGGITTLAANVLTIGIVGPLVAIALMRLFSWRRPGSDLAVAISCAVGSLAVYVAATGIIAFGLMGEQTFIYWASRIFVGVAPVQLPLMVLEGTLSVFLLRGIMRRHQGIAPHWLRPRNSKQVLALSVLVVGLFTMPSSPALAYEDLDEAVFEEAGRLAGRDPGPVFDIEEGPWGDVIFAAGFFAAGFIAGKSWERLGSPNRDKPS